MSGISGIKGKELLLAVLDELKNIDPRIVPFDSDEVQMLEYGVVQGVRDVFGSDAPEYSDFEDFKISAGNISRGDSRAEKQSKYELGLPMAVKRIEEVLDLIDQSDEKIRELPPEDLVKIDADKNIPPAKPSPPKPVPRAKSAPDPEPKAKPASKPALQLSSDPTPGTEKRKTQQSVAKHPQPGKILLLQEGGSDVSDVVASLLKKIGIDVDYLDEDTSSEMERLIGLKNTAFTIVAVSTEPRGGLSGLTSVIGKPQSRNESIFKLGLLVGSLGPGKVVILHSGEKVQDIPQELYGIRYIPYKEEGGWQIGLLKLLKANGFYIDANLLFE